MIKEAKTTYPVNELIKKRWSARSFAEKEISQDELNTIFEASSWAFSAMNYQPWKYIYVHKSDADNFQKFVDCLAGGNQPWAKNASVLIVSLAKKNYDDGTPNKAAFHDVGASNATLILQAASMDIYGHLMGGFDKNKAVALTQIDSDEYEPVVFIALGYLDTPEKLDEPFKSREKTKRTRKNITEFATEFKEENKPVFV